MVVSAEDEQGYIHRGSIGAHNNIISFRDGSFPCNSTTPELAALIWAYAWIYAHFHSAAHKPDVTIQTDS
eukprot:8477275-Pyramimonas_sp.AAC.1